jgi:two-component system nitrogen regulation response regulator GlnG
MLRVLQEQQFERLGGNEPVRTHVRVLAATNKDLQAEVADGRFRKDLYYRLKVVTLIVPPLRARVEDVSELANYFLARFNRELRLDLHDIAPATLQLLQAHLWPGNVRELQSAIKQAMLNASGRTLLPEFLPPEVNGQEPGTRNQEAGGRGPHSATLALDDLIETCLREAPGRAYDKVIEAVERELLTQALRHTHGHQARASDLLGLNRATLRAKLKALDLAVDKVIVDKPDAEEG